MSNVLQEIIDNSPELQELQKKNKKQITLNERIEALENALTDLALQQMEVSE